MGLSSEQFATLTALCDTFVPSIARDDDPDGYWARSASATGTPQVIAHILGLAAPEDQAQIAALLDLLAGPQVNFGALDAVQREQVLQAWQHSPVADLRAAYSVLASLVLPMHYGYADARGPNPAWKSIGYDGPIAAPPRVERPIVPVVVSADTVLDCDTVIVGSGAGGGVVAGELAEAGEDVIVVEKGPYVAEDGFTQREVEMTLTLYEKGGSLRTRDANILVLAGSCLGGGTTINWSGALRAPDYVRQEWAVDHGNPQFLSPAFQRSIDAVEAATHVDLEETHVDAKGRALQRGCDALGYKVVPYPRNVKGCDPAFCGYCNFGCQKGAKQGTMVTYLQQAHARGARILVGTTVNRVVVEAGLARGIEAVQVGADGSQHRVTVRAKRVVVAAGSIHTPALLRRSGLTHPWIGRNLFLHPAAGVPALYPEPIRAWSGSMMPLSCDEFTRLDGNHGFKIINAPLHPGFFTLVGWRSAADHKEQMLKASRMSTLGAFVRDRDTGRIEVDGNGQPVVDYTTSEYDMRNLVRGLQECARLHFAAGAERLFLPGGRRFECAQGQAKLEELLAEMPTWPWDGHRMFMMTAHQMGTCRMGGDAATHPLTPTGHTVEVPNLFVADASTFPTCSGSNPMPSVQHIAHYIAQGMRAAV
ncbi:MAG TPA: GMC family oxidoreductase N-terminal domain-containing protein [Kofleriaceae bacterium]|nr:GMC family oxidoreductase N-terminal domain-containing protein [Kofleriaceae bacterium]